MALTSNIQTADSALEGKSEKGANNLFPIFLKIDKLKVLIIGGGNVALEKVNAVLSNSPETNITLVAPEILPEINAISLKYANLKIKNREFFPGDLFHADIVIAATADKKLNKTIKQEAEKRSILANVADTPDLCDFYLASIVKKGDLKIAISTNGKSPTVAKRIKEVLDDTFPNETQDLLNNINQIRSKLHGDFASKVKKLNEITSLLTTESNLASSQPNKITEISEPTKNKKTGYWVINSLAALSLMIVGHVLFSFFPSSTFSWFSGDVATKGFILTGIVIIVVSSRGFLKALH